MQATELFEMKYSPLQNQSLEASFKEFYKLPSSPKVFKKLMVPKESYKQFFKSRTRERTQFEAGPSEIDLSFDDKKVPFEFVGTMTEFLMPSGANIVLFEELDAPCGLTKRVEFVCGDERKEFDSYFQAEAHVLCRFLKEILMETK